MQRLPVAENLSQPGKANYYRGQSIYCGGNCCHKEEAKRIAGILFYVSWSNLLFCQTVKAFSILLGFLLLDY